MTNSVITARKKDCGSFQHAIWRLLYFVHAMNIDEIRNIICVVYAHCMNKMKEPPYWNVPLVVKRLCLFLSMPYGGCYFFSMHKSIDNSL